MICSDATKLRERESLPQKLQKLNVQRFEQHLKQHVAGFFCNKSTLPKQLNCLLYFSLYSKFICGVCKKTYSEKKEANPKKIWALPVKFQQFSDTP